ncbi:MAG: hypothetical protein ACK4PR_13445, partial [Gammaproteobacteria bacterium]
MLVTTENFSAVIKEVENNEHTIDTLIFKFSKIKSGQLLELFIALNQNIYVTSLDFSGNKFTADASLMLPLLENAHKLCHLNLSNTQLGEMTCGLLSEYLKSNQTLISLDLSHNNARRSIMVIAEALNSHPCLEQINLSYNNVDQFSADIFFSKLANPRKLTNINMSNNNIGDLGMAAIIKFLHVNNLIKHLDLSYTNICSLGIEKLGVFLAGTERDTDCNLEQLNISGNTLTNSAVVFLIAAINLGKVKKSLRIIISSEFLSSESLLKYLETKCAGNVLEHTLITFGFNNVLSPERYKIFASIVLKKTIKENLNDIKEEKASIQNKAEVLESIVDYSDSSEGKKEKFPGFFQTSLTEEASSSFCKKRNSSNSPEDIEVEDNKIREAKKA